MIEPTDASKCDERQVKNKLNPLTKKKEGETRVMFSKSMKTWKLAVLFFVVGAMMVGVFAGEASAQAFTPDPKEVTSGAVIDTFTVTYKAGAGGVTATAGAATTAVSIEILLPTELTAAAEEDADGDAVTGSFEYTGTFDGTADLTRNRTSFRNKTDGSFDSRDTSYVEVRWLGSGTLDVDGVTVGSAGAVTVVVAEPLRSTDRIEVTYRKVQVAKLQAGDLTAGKREAGTVSKAASTTPAYSVDVRFRAFSKVMVATKEDSRKPIEVKMGSTTDVTVSYEVEEDVLLEGGGETNTIMATLPTDWKAAYGAGFGAIDDGIDLSDRQKRMVMSPDEDADGNPLSYVTVGYSASGTRTNTAAVAVDNLDNSVDVTVTGTMMRRDTVTITFHNVKVETAEMASDFTDGKKDVILAVTDSILGSSYTEDGDDVSVYDEGTTLSVLPPNSSDITVRARSSRSNTVMADSVDDITVTYEAGDTLYNVELDGSATITIDLPNGWVSAHGADFGTISGIIALRERDEAVMSPDEDADGNPLSYVRVEYDSVGSNRMNTAEVTLTGTAIEVVVFEDIESGDEIVVTYYNVKIPNVEGREPEDLQARIAVTDTIPTATYAEDEGTVFAITPPAFSEVNLLSKTRFLADSVDDITVSYKVMYQVSGSNDIRVELPRDWEAASGTFGDDPDNIDLAATPERKTAASNEGSQEPMTSYVTVTYDALETGRTNTAAVGITTDSVTVDVTGTMMMGDTVTITFHGVAVPGTTSPTPEPHQLSVTDSIVGSAGEYDGDTMIYVRRQTLSEVSVSPNAIKSGATRNITVTYTALATVSDNVITIELPAKWDVPAGQPTVTETDLTENSYVLSGDNPVTITVTGDMTLRESIKVTFEGVTVQTLTDGTAEPEQVRVTDKMTGPSGTDYDTPKTRITVTPVRAGDASVLLKSVEAGDTLKTVTVTYTARDVVSGHEIAFGLPEGWEAAYSAFETTPGVPTTGSATKSYVVVRETFAGDPTTLTIDANGDVVVVGDMKGGNRITVTYHNVMVRALTVAELGDRDEPVKDEFTVRDVRTTHMPNLTVNHPTLSDIRVTPHDVKEKATPRTVTVTYQVKHSKLMGNEIGISPPQGLTSPDFASTFRPIDPSNPRRGVTTLPTLATNETEADYTYVTVTDTVAAEFSTAAVRSDGTFTVTGDMELNEKITVIYHNMKISELPSVSAGDVREDGTPRKIIRDSIVRHIDVTDSAVSPNGSAYKADSYKNKIRITTTATNLSAVSVAPMSVKPESVEKTMTVTYTAQDTVYDDNTITVALPIGWEAATAGFGSDFDKSIDLAAAAASTTATKGVVSTLAEGATAATASYVTVQYTPQRGTRTNTAEVSISGNEVTIPVMGNMAARDRIVVTYHNVKVQALTASELDDRPPPPENAVMAQFTVTDEITGSDYAAKTQVTVEHPILSDIRVTPTRPVTAESIIDMTVTYTAKDTLYAGNPINIRIPEEWDPAYPEHSPTFVDETDVSAGEKATTSYVKITERLSGKGAKFRVDDITSDGVFMTVDGDMKNGDRIVVSFHNVKVEPLATRASKKAKIVVTDKLSTDGEHYAEMTPPPQLTVIPQDLNSVTVAPTKVQASSIVDTVKVTYVVTDEIAEENEIIIGLPSDWDPAYANDGDPAATASVGFGSDFDKSINLAATATATTATKGMVSTLADPIATGGSASKASYVTVQYTPQGGTRTNTAAVSINGNEVKIPVMGDMKARDRIVVTYHNVEIPALLDREALNVYIAVTDVLSVAGNEYNEQAMIRVDPPPMNAVTATPTAATAETVTDVKVTYSIRSGVLERNTITVGLPTGWSPAYLPNDASSPSNKSFGRLIEPSRPSTNRDSTSYVVVTSSTLKGSGDNSEYAVLPITNPEADASIVIEVEGTAVRGDSIVVTFYNVRVRAAPPATATLTVEDTFSGGASFAHTIKVNSPDMNTVAVTPTKATAETVTDVKVTYSVKSTVIDENTITVGLPAGWSPAYLPNDGLSASRSFGSSALSALPSANKNITSYVVVTSTLDADEFEVSDLDSSDANAGLTIEVEDTAVKGDNIVVTFYNVKVQALSSHADNVAGKDLMPVEAMLAVTDTIAGATTFVEKTKIAVSELKRGTITRLPTMVTAEDAFDAKLPLRIRYTATDDLADPNPDGDEGTNDATYGRIQIAMPAGWSRSDANLTVAGSQSVVFATPSDPADVAGQVITIDVDSLKKGKYVDITFEDLRVADFPADEAGDKLYAQVEVLSDSFDSAGDRNTDLAAPAAHLSSKFSPKVAFTAATATTDAYGSDVHPTIMVNRKYLGEVAVTPGSVVAEATTDLKVRYTATNTLADPSDSDTATAGVQATSFGRVQITLPVGWGPATDSGIHTKRQASDRDATYLNLRKSSGVTAVDLSENSFELDSDRYRINIDVNAMRSRQWVELTVHNLMIAPLSAERTGSFDPDITASSEKVQVEVFSETFSVVSDRDGAFEQLESPSAHSPVKGKFKPYVKLTDKGSETQPTLTVTRKQLGKVAIAPAKVSAGSAQKFTITYTASEMLVENSVIEVRLPNWGGDDHSGVPTPYQLDDDPIPAADDKGPHVYLSGSKSRLEGSTVAVQEDGDTSIVRIALGEKGLARNNSVDLKFEGVTVQRQIAEKVLIEVFSSDSVDLSVPQYPVEKPEEDKIEVTHAADGSGKVMFEFDGVEVKAFDNDKIKSNTDASVPASLTKDDTFDLIVTYMPEGDMVGDSGTAEFQITLPGNWQAEDVRSSGSDVSRSGNTITAKFKDHFGEIAESLEIVLEDITVPDDHGNDRFVAKSRNAKGSLKQLSPVPMVFVGNTLADNDTMSVEIDPLAAYEGEEDVDFEITLTANGPMHNSDIQITVPDGIESLQTGESGDPNYVRKVAPSGSGVVVRVDDANDENIFITTGKLNKGGTIIVRLNNVDIDGDVSTDNATGFRVSTRTRGTDSDAADGDDGDKHKLTDVAWEPIEKDDGKRSIVGGEIRTITGSGAIALKPATVQQGSQNVDFDFTFTALTAFSNKTLEIVAPSVIETPLKETAGDGQVTVSGGKYHSDVAAKDRLVVSDDTITVAGLILRKGERFAIKVNNVDLFDRTGEFRWAVTLDGTALRDADNPAMVVVGTTQGDVAFEIVDDTGAPISAPEYNAASMQSIRFRFTAENTVIQPGGTLRFTVPVEWSQPSVTDRANRATVSIVHLDDDGNETFVDKVADKWALSARRRDVTLTIDPKGKLDPGSSVIIRYGTPDTKYPVQISASVRGTAASDVDGLSIRGRFKVSSATGFPERDAGRIWVDITNVKDGTGTATITPLSVRASSTDNRIRVVYTAIGTMDGGAVRITIPQNWGLPQNDDAAKPNYVNVTVSSGAKLTSEVLHDDGRFVQANLTTLGAGDNVSFTYGGRGANRGAVAQADLGDAVFLVESRGSSGGTFEAIVDNMDKAVSPIVEVKSARSGSGTVAVTTTKNKSGSVVYDGVAERRIFAGDDKTYLVLTYTAEQTIAEGELELIVPRGWTAPQQDDTNRPGYTYIEEGNALVSEEEYNGQSVTATVEMDRGDVIKIHYGWYATENGGAHAPQVPGTSVFRVEFDGVAVASPPSVIVHGGTASKLVVTAPSDVSADPGTMPVAITVEIQDDTNATAVAGSDLEVTLSSTSSTGSFTDADGEEINTVTIPAGSTEATVYYSDTGAGTTATVRASAVGLNSGRDTIEVTTDISDEVDENSISVSPAMAKAGDRVTVTASGTAGKTATFSVGSHVSNRSMSESPSGSGTYTGTVPVVPDLQDGTHNVMVMIGTASATKQNALTVDTTMPSVTITAPAADMTVANGDTVMISATVSDAGTISSVMADVSMLDSTQTTNVELTMANGSYSISVTISDDNEALNGSKTITVTAMDAVGNSAMSTAMVTLDNKLSYTSMIPMGQSLFHVPLDVEGLDTIGDLKAKIGSAVTNAIVPDVESGQWNARADDMPITAALGILLVMDAEASVTFEGEEWGGGIGSELSLSAGSNNLIGLPVNDPRVTNVSDIMGLFAPGVVTGITVSTGDPANPFVFVSAAGATGDGPVMGDAAYLVTATSAATVRLVGKGWSNGDTAAAPIALAGYNVDGQTAVLDVSGAVVDEITGLAREGFRVKVKNLSTKASLSKVTSVEAADGYNMTFVDLKAANAARIGDVLEISADSPSPLIGVKPVRHMVTVDDVKNSTIQLENLIAYEIPAETELLRNYPNPFNPETWIPYHLAEDADVSLTIYDTSGRLVRTIDVGHQTAAKYDTRSKSIYWDGRNRFGEQVASGLYFYSLSAGDFSATRRMVILK